MSLQNEIKKRINKFKNKKKPYKIYGANNRIILVNENGIEQELTSKERIKDLDIEIYGSNNIIRIFEPLNCKGTKITIGKYPRLHNDGAYIEIQSSSYFLSNTIVVNDGKNQVLKIGKETTMFRSGIILAEEAHITIGDNCMFGGLSFIRGADGHTIYDCETGELINKDMPGIIIGNHCWIGSNAIILKKAKIPDNSVVAEGSIVTKSFETSKQGGIILAGIPAKIKREGINWSRLSPSYFRETNQNPLEVEHV